MKCVQMNYKLAYHDPKREAVGGQALWRCEPEAELLGGI